ncbi:MAG: elongation factor 1-beta [archaeon]
MAKVIITLKIMPASPDTDLDKLEHEVKKHIEHFAGEGDMKVEINPIAFGLKELRILFVADESKGGTDSLEEEIGKLEDVNSVEVVDVRRAIG